MDRIIERLAKENDYNYNILKAIEELNELSTVLTQHLTKGVKYQEILDEIGDVDIRIKVLKKLFNKDKIEDRVNYKLNKFSTYLDEGKYIGRI